LNGNRVGISRTWYGTKRLTGQAFSSCLSDVTAILPERVRENSQNYGRVDEWTRNDIYDVIDVYIAETVMFWNECRVHAR
jgi:hypothetical protein